MILPNTTYHTYENIPVRIKNASMEKIPNISGVLKEDQAFKVSVWADPREDWLQIELDKAQEQLKLNQENKELNSIDAIFYIQVSRLLENCESNTDFAKAIYFYSPLEDYGAFSNFSEQGIEVEGLFYPSVEHYYQAQKFEDIFFCEKIRKAATPKIAADLGKQRNLSLKNNWEAIKVSIMTKAIEQKTEQHPDFKNLLLSTNNALLIENSPYDNFWGIG